MLIRLDLAFKIVFIFSKGQIQFIVQQHTKIFTLCGCVDQIHFGSLLSSKRMISTPKLPDHVTALLPEGIFRKM